MFPGDRIFRPVVHPKACPAGILDEDAYFQFREVDNKTYRISVGSRFLTRDIDGAHSFGLTVADAQDSSARRNQEARGEGSQNRICYYIGFYDTTWDEIQQSETDTYNICIYWSPENGLDSHFNLSLHQKETDKNRRQRKNDRLVIQNSIVSRLNGLYNFDYKYFYGAGAPPNVGMPKKGRIYE